MSYEPHQQTPLSGHFEENSPRYRFLCCHVRIWALVIGILELIGLVLQFCGGIGNYVSGYGWRGGEYASSAGLSGLIGGILGIVIGIIVVALMLYGVKKIRPGFVIPHLIMQIIAIILLIISAIGYFVLAGTYSRSKKEREDESGYIVGAFVGSGIGMLIGAGIEILFFYAILRAYRYLKDKKLAIDSGEHVPVSTSYSSVEKGRL